MTIQANASVEIDSMAVYPSDWSDAALTGAYDTTKDVNVNRYVNHGEALLKVYGTLKVNNEIAGNVYATSADKLTLPSTQSLTLYEAITVSGSKLSASLKDYQTIPISYAFKPLT